MHAHFAISCVGVLTFISITVMLLHFCYIQSWYLISNRNTYLGMWKSFFILWLFCVFQIACFFCNARGVEMECVAQHGVYAYAHISECRQKTKAEPIDTRWIDTNKGDAEHPCYRSRWVAKQFRRAWIETIFSATPNIESVRLLLADCANRCRKGGSSEEDTMVMVIDIK